MNNKITQTYVKASYYFSKLSPFKSSVIRFLPSRYSILTGKYVFANDVMYVEVYEHYGLFYLFSRRRHISEHDIMFTDYVTVG